MSFKHGGIHCWELTPAEIRQAATVSEDSSNNIGTMIDNKCQWLKITITVYLPTLLLTNLAAVFFYKRILVPRLWSLFDIWIWFQVILIAIIYVGLLAVGLFPCVHEPCINKFHLAAICGIFNFVSNFLIVIIPFTALTHLNINAIKRRRIMYIFAIALV